ncbi:MAG: hypothetical protein FVQ85_06350 [Planctomycetes bacterium]|nr:hypothetical protein [Planctomycetota bacterium]
MLYCDLLEVEIVGVFVENEMIDFISTKWLNRTRKINFALFICVVVMSFLVDGNGRISGLSEKASYVITVLFFSFGILLSSVLTIIDKRYRFATVLFLIVYLILAAPAVWPF